MTKNHLNLRVLALGVAAGILLGMVQRASSESPDMIGSKVTEFARKQLGKKVGDGECATLAAEALKAANAKTTFDFGVSGADKDYIWGTLVEKSEDARPGDIIQFRDVKIVTKMVTTTKTGTSTRTMMATIQHHTSIVSQNLGNGKFKVLEQNAGSESTSDKKRKLVQENVLNLADKIDGKVWIYRPEPKK